MVPFVEGCLADAELGVMHQELRTMNGDSRFRVLVAARGRALAGRYPPGSERRPPLRRNGNHPSR
jgi:hypothetical protein